MTGRALPWHVVAPYEGCNGEKMSYSVWDADGNIVAECDGEDDGREEALLIATVINRGGPEICAMCGEPATCFGAYEDCLSPGYACDDCCGHGCEDGKCEPISIIEPSTRESK